MRPSAFLQTIVVLVCAAIFGAAVPTAPDTAKRAFTSGGQTCYYVCPSTVSVSLGTLNLISGTTVLGVGVCYYRLGLVTYTCNYLASSGVGVPNANVVCPTQITTVQCGNQPSNSFKKRSEIDAQGRIIKKRTPKEQRIAARQFDFKKRALEKANTATLKRGALH